MVGQESGITSCYVQNVKLGGKYEYYLYYNLSVLGAGMKYDVTSVLSMLMGDGRSGCQ